MPRSATPSPPEEAAGGARDRSTAKRVLIVEDDCDFVHGLQNNLEIEGYEVDVAGDGRAGLERARARAPDLLILDLMLPEIDGYSVLRSLRKEGFETPVLILTARGEPADKVRGFRSGADQYVTKPVDLQELLARVEVLLRRAGGASAGDDGFERFGNFEVDPAARTVTRAGEPVSLAPKEFDLLLALIRRRGAVASRLELQRDVWGHNAVILSRTVDVHISALRHKLGEDPANPEHILTVLKAGYRFVP